MLVSDSLLETLGDIFGFGGCFVLSLLGLATNIINIVVFTRQGFQETTNISLCAIAVFDLCKCVSGFVHRWHRFIRLINKPLAVSWQNITYINDLSLHAITGAMVNAITAYVSIERCLCVSLPFKVKNIITPSVTYAALLVLAFVIISSYFHTFVVFKIIWVDNPVFNQSVAVYKLSPILQTHPGIYEYTSANSILWPVTTFVVIVTCTVLFLIRLRESSQFRIGQGNAMISRHQFSVGLNESLDENASTCSSFTSVSDNSISLRFSTASSSSLKTDQRKLDIKPRRAQTESNTNTQTSQMKRQHLKTLKPNSLQVSNRDKKVMKMLLVVIVVYLVNVIPRIVVSIVRYIEPEFFNGKDYSNVHDLVLHLIFTLDFFNASTNLFIFLTMSSRFRATFRQLLS